MARQAALEGKLVVLVGGSGFLGKHVAQALLDRGARLRIAARHPRDAWTLRPLANLGQLQFVHCDVRKPESLAAALRGADAAAYLVGAFKGDLDELQANAAGRAAAIAAREGMRAFAYVSALGADAESEIAYASSKAKGERLVQGAFPNATILRPSVLFGEDDAFVNMFAGLIAALPALPVFGAEAKLQPLHVDDAAEALANALADPARHGGQTYEIVGPEALTMMELHRRIAAAQYRQRALFAVPDLAAAIFAALPGTPMTREQWALLKASKVADGALPGIKDLGVVPKPLALFLDRWMTRYRKHGRFGDKRELA
ncbi:MAG TPA: SDR family NAD(P)-dependent oxidoreductase [Croceibacterium sp.]|nr:SDR family NAD(P)-dependent oxidoreductase [Croceibacterium sp.]